MRTEPEPGLDSNLSKGLAILEELKSLKSGVGVSDLSREVGLTVSNTFRFLQNLKTSGYVRLARDQSCAATLKALLAQDHGLLRDQETMDLQTKTHRTIADAGTLHK